MTSETRERIKQYEGALPHIKEKITAAAVLLVIAMTIMVTATYAWITLSTSPEVTSIDTTVAANGALEIAMANGTGAAPGRSAAGDSTGKDNNVVRANNTWGNLVNLSDPSYGLANVVLRPAALNGTTGLLTNPLYGVEYGEDGRVTGMVIGDDFAYTYFDPNATTTGEGMFLVDLKGEHLGVRAISTVKFENLEGATQMNALLKAANASLTEAKSNYAKITNEKAEPGKSYITSLQGLIQIYAQNVIDKKPQNTLDVTEYVPNLYNMVQDIYDSVMLKVGESYVYMANLYDVLKGDKQGNWFVGNNALEELIAEYKANKLPQAFTEAAVGFKQFVTDYQSFQIYLKKGAKEDFSDLSAYQQKNSLACWAYKAKSGTTVYWTDISTQINWLCSINTATINGKTLNQLSSMSAALDILNAKERKAVLHDGAVKRLEKRLGQQMNPKIKITVDPSGLGGVAALAGKQTLDATVTTDAAAPYDAEEDIKAVKALNTGSYRGDTATAEDTHALAVDLWLRTNAGASAAATATIEEGTDEAGKTYTKTTDPLRAYLTLEGKVLLQDIEQRATVKAPDGNTYDAFTATVTSGSDKYEQEVYQKEQDTNYYYVDENNKEEKFSPPPGPTVQYTPKMEKVTIVTGYDGVNRVWNDTQMAPYEVEGATSTTQGGGSCYTFYASTEADQQRFLDLLGSMRVAFVDGKGTLIGAATMDTEHYYAENGKVTVPLALDKSSAVSLGVDKDGNSIYGLMPLVKNAATRITAIVYLDGTKLTNQMVLASGDIQGNLNVQFGSCTAYKITTVTQTTDAEGNAITSTAVDYKQEGNANESIENEPVMTETIKVSASLNGSTEVDYNPQNPQTNVGVNVKIEGKASPNSVYVRFIRAISSTQGVQQEIVNLTGNGDSWNGTVTFNKPGNYVLRTVWVDGAEYDLSHEPLKVTIRGASVNSITCDAITGGNFARIMQSGSSFKTNMTLGFTSSEQTPSRVNGIFMDEDGRQVNVPFYLEGGNWKGTAVFYTSGTYTMKYVEIDGDQFEIRTELQPTLELQLGLKSGTRISANADTQAKIQTMAPEGMIVSPTRFVLDPSKGGKDGVTLTVTTKLYDNTGEEIKGLSDVRIYYSRVGSVNGRDANLTWNASAGAYVGEFHIEAAGTYRFSHVKVGTNTITAATADTNSIQVMPPDDARYMQGDLHTDAYQYAPSKNAKMTVAIAYSSAATRVEAVIEVNGTEYTVPGIMGAEDTEHQTDDITSINLWNFWQVKQAEETVDRQPLPEGRWTLKSITLYGVYYDGTYYDDEKGVTVDLSGENITTKVVNNIMVTLSGTSRNFTGYFMDDHKVNDLTVTVADYEGEVIRGVKIGDVKVQYTRGAVGLDSEYGYTVNALAPTVYGDGSLKSGSATEYKIAEMNFQIAGPYRNAVVELTVDGVSGTAGNVTGTVLKYVVNGSASENCPQYDVKWHVPDVKIIGTDPAMGKTFNVNMAGGSDIAFLQMQNYYEDYYACLGISAEKANYIFLEIPKYTVPKVTLKLENGGKIYQSATFEAHTKINGTAITCGFSFPTGKDAPTVTGYMGRIGDANSTSGSSTRGSVNETISIITMQYGGVDYVLNLANPITIKTVNGAKPRLDYIVPEEYAGYITLPATKGGQNGDGRNFKETLPGNISFTIVEQPEVSKDEMGTPTTNTTTSNLYYRVTTSDCNGEKTTYYPVTRTVETKVYQKELPVNSNQYTVTSWNIEKAKYNTESSDPLIKEWSKVGTYKPGKEITVNEHWRATPVAEITSTSVGETRLVTYTVITTTDNRGKGTSSKPSGTEIDQSAVLTKPEVVETWS